MLKFLTRRVSRRHKQRFQRDIHALNIVKANDGDGHTHYVQLHATPEHNFERLYQGIHDNVRTIETVQFMNVIKTALNSSYATILAGMFDELDIPEVVGTLLEMTP